MTADTSLWRMVVDASPVVQFVLALLMAISLISWWVIFRKYMALARARRAANRFENDFWSGTELTALFDRVGQRRRQVFGMEAIFLAGFQEFLRLRAQLRIDGEALVSGTQRAMRATLAREVDDLETYLPILATTGSTSPYIGLFGTVWGIMNSFRALGTVQQATLAQVAPGIAEALIATAMGLFAAIPAVMAYNRYANEVNRLINRYDSFVEEFSNILQRQSHQLRKLPADS